MMTGGACYLPALGYSVPMRRSAVSLLLALVFVTLGGSALAQIDAQSQALLDGLAPPVELQTVDRTMVMTMYTDDGELVTSTRSVIDYVNRRAVIFTDLGGGMVARMVHVDGTTTMRMEGMPMAMPVPPGMGDTFDTIFDQTATLSDDPNATAVYDGQVSYGDIVSGQQVTYTATYDLMGTPTETVSRFIFDSAGEYIATVTDGVDGGLSIMVYDEPAADTVDVVRGFTIYQFKDGVGTLFSRTSFENVSVNQPLDEALFQ